MMKTFSSKKAVLFIIKSRHSIHWTTVLKNMKVLDVKIDNLSRKEILDRIRRFLDEPKFHQVATVNPEFLMEADRNLEFKDVLNHCDLRVADGFGLSLIAFFRGEKLKCRFPGVDLMEEVLKMANEKKLSVYLAVRADGLSSYEEVRSVILKRFPNVFVSGQRFKIEDLRFMNAMDQESYSKIRNHKSKIIFSNFGAPHQEFFLAGLRSQATECRLAVGLGGAFDFLTGKRKRAPKWLRAIGLEWLWRVIQQPSRIRRIWNAVIVFPMRVLLK